MLLSAHVPFLFKMVRCLSCGLVYLNPRLNESGLNEFYETYFGKPRNPDYNIEQVNSSPHLADLFLEKMEIRCHRGSLLDVGCGRGAFLQRARSKGWNVFGVEFSETAAWDARRSGLDVFTGDLSEAKFPSCYFDVVTLFNVIEHLRDPLCNVKEVHRILKDN
jgi:SAM-dependent methyltransferase